MPTNHEDHDPENGCPKCGGALWDNRATKRNPKAPDYRCKDRNCDGAIWPPKNGTVMYEKHAVQPHPTGAKPPQAKQGFSSGGPLPGEEQETGAPPVTNGAVARLDGIFSVYSACFAFANSLAHQTLGADCTHEGISAMAATVFIASKN